MSGVDLGLRRRRASFLLGMRWMMMNLIVGWRSLGKIKLLI